MRHLLLVLILGARSYAQLSHLTPVGEGISDIAQGRQAFGYHQLVYERLFHGQPTSNVFMLKIEAFRPERLLLLHESEGKFRITLREPKLQIWSHTESAVCPEIVTTNSEIDAALAKRIMALWHRELHLTRWPDEKPPSFFDGVQYFLGGTFLHREKGRSWTHFMIGGVECPDDDSRIGALTAVGALLLRYLELPEELRRCTSEDERRDYLDAVAAGKIVVDWPLVLDGDRAYFRDKFLNDPWSEIQAGVSQAEKRQG